MGTLVSFDSTIDGSPTKKISEVRIASIEIDFHRLNQGLGARFVRDPEGARKAVHVGASAPNSALPEIELAAYALVANTLLNLDETVTRN